jgi:hypothetical protein
MNTFAVFLGCTYEQYILSTSTYTEPEFVNV